MPRYDYALTVEEQTLNRLYAMRDVAEELGEPERAASYQAAIDNVLEAKGVKHEPATA